MEELQYQEGRTEINHIGKEALVNLLTEPFKKRNKTTTSTIGDDAAIIGTGRLRRVVSTQTMVEGIHFDMMYTPLKHLGYKAVAVALSNIAAMNATARQVLVSIAVSNRYSVEALQELYQGIYLCCDRYDVDLIGGETTLCPAGMTITTTAIGEVETEKITYRNGAQTHDLIFVSGDLGSAYSGLLVLEREKVTYMANPNFQPDLASFDYVLERFLKPEPRFDIIKMLADKGVVPTSMIDISTGLAGEALHLCKSSGCGCEIYEDKLPIDYQTTRVCSEMSQNMLPTSCALNGGGDYELLFTIKQSDYDKLKDLSEIHVVGHITAPGSAAVMVTPQNTTIELRAQAFSHAE
ncbi:MAG: thiamine-phosphate kinase [Bacteroidales bacterium]|nr:thiamine-phosphate kinase [Bacteroidales bacterium]